MRDNKQDQKYEAIFRRAVILLVVILVVSIGWTLFIYLGNENYYTNSVRVTADECREYLLSQDIDWTYEGDYYYQSECDLKNPNSYHSIQMEFYDRSLDQVQSGGTFSLSVSGLILALFTLRWLLTGKVKVKLRKKLSEHKE